ncbi:MAG: YbjN domain-containing protein [Anaerolineae bacterium]|jgi:hypothetical protein|nr:YbjN domain-containing protein [Anaerolineae bacterium]
MSEQQIFDAVVEFFEADDWKFQWLEGMTVLSMGFAGKNGKWVCYAQAREPQQQFVFYSVLPVNVPEAKRPALAEFITRANYGMIIGNFEMDFEDGEIRYKTSIDVEGTSLGPQLIRQMVYANVLITDRYLSGIMAVIYGGKDPAAAVSEIEAEDAKNTAPGGEPLEREDFSVEDDDDEDDLEGGPRLNGRYLN